MVGVRVWSDDTLGYADGSIPPGRVCFVEMVKGEDPDKAATQKRKSKGSEGGWVFPKPDNRTHSRNHCLEVWGGILED